MLLKRRLFKCRITDAKFPTLKKKSKCRTCDRKVSKIPHDSRRILGRNVVVVHGHVCMSLGVSACSYFPCWKSNVEVHHYQSRSARAHPGGACTLLFWPTCALPLHHIWVAGSYERPYPWCIDAEKYHASKEKCLALFLKHIGLCLNSCKKMVRSTTQVNIKLNCIQWPTLITQIRTSED